MGPLLGWYLSSTWWWFLLLLYDLTLGVINRQSIFSLHKNTLPSLPKLAEGWT